MWRLLWRAHDGLTRASFMLAAAAIAAILLAYVREVVGRYFFQAPTMWSDDVVGYMLCLSTFLALPQITRDKGHVAVTLLLDAIGPRSRRGMEAGIAAAGAIFCALAAYISGIENARQIAEGVETLSNYPIPKWWITVVITFGLALSALYFLRQAIGVDRLEQRQNSIG
jgi:TRAP-type C4-dicarboxylate transport system permease small subunit